MGLCICRSFLGRPRHTKINHALTRGKYRPAYGQTQCVTVSVNLCFSSSMFFLHIFLHELSNTFPPRAFLCVLFILFLEISNFLFWVYLCLLVIGIISGPLVSTSRFDFATFITSVRANPQPRVEMAYVWHLTTSC